jgi:hypothetical protein
MYGKFNIGLTSISHKDKEVFKIDNMFVTNIANSNKDVLTSSWEINGMYADLSTIEDEEAKATLTSVGISEIDARMFGKGVWELETGRLNISESIIDVKNIGRLNTTADLLGYTMAVVKSTYTMQKDLVGLDITSPEYEAKSQAMIMSLLGQLSLGEISIRYDDYGITNKILDLLATQQGSKREELVAGFSMMAPMLLASFNVPELQAQVSTAVTSYLNDPKNFEIKTTPANPTPFMAFVALAQTPPALVEALNISVIANQ